MNPGKLNRRIVLKSVTRVADGIGGFVETNVTKKTTWASISPLTNREQLLYGIEIGVRAYVVKLRWDASYNIDQSYWIEYSDRFGGTVNMRIVSVVGVNEDARQIVLLAEERTD